MLIVKHAKNGRREVPSDAALEQIAKMPEDVKKMALAYAQGVASGQRISKSA